VIISRTPVRISFFGGGTDYPAWFRTHGGAVLATTIDKYCYISVRELPPFFPHRYRLVYSVIESVREVREIRHPAVRAVLEWLANDRGLEIHHDGDVPARSGIGSSSAFTVGFLHAMRALQGIHISRDELAKEAIHVEQCVIREAVGSQDQICAAFGGLNHIVFREDGAHQVTPVVIDRDRLDALQQRLILLFTGIVRDAPEIARSKIENLRNRTEELHAMHQMVVEAINILTCRSAPMTDFGRLLHESWKLKSRLSDRVTNAEIDSVYDAARKAGAIGGKLLGAGGGGFMLLFVEPERRQSVKNAVSHLLEVPFRFESQGSRIVLYQPNGL
jgi:D-glycero-alpha-D-manno-heptose-7-phosphate kinase